ncbi:hypothetical protein M970_081670 [Encephalitozoon cuniculi EcunIII-L]|uniref:Uncharacterized protein n=1 Tax=Encephalitozoon cuniculi TaxID=6035 RepID=M1K2Q8_ENCCN|nr:hypothetical protein ECU08_1650 [Encephalitozoon cuniculi]KMV65692.1 hypothetical protein M970_081670 [Encephalitozoon cuniculi EcunIII-L]UYI27098.1 hypothetical protein J0A71_04g09480 [Encephalitozoon cuniculi]
MDIEKKISSVTQTAGKWLEDFRYMASIALNFLECFFYSLVGIICLMYSEKPLNNIWFKYFSCVLIVVGVIDGLHKVPTTYLAKNSNTKSKTFRSRIINRLKELRRFFIENKINRMIDFIGNLLMIFAISVVLYSTWTTIKPVLERSDDGGYSSTLNALFCSSGLYNLLSLLYSFYILIKQGCQYISDFKKRGTYSNNAGIRIRFENGEEEHDGTDKDPFSNMPVITLTEVVFMLIFAVWGAFRGGAGYIKKTLTPSVVVFKISTSTLQYMVPFFRHSGSKNAILLPIIFISLLSICAYIINGLELKISELVGSNNLRTS